MTTRNDLARKRLTPDSRIVELEGDLDAAAHLLNEDLPTMVRWNVNCRGKTRKTWNRMRRGGIALEVTEHEVELDVTIVYGAAVHTGYPDEADVKRVLVGADFGNTWKIPCQR